MPDIYRGDGPTTKAIKAYVAQSRATTNNAVIMLARAIDELRDKIGVTEYERLQQEAQKGYDQ